jgi:hypothetical protein
MFVPWEKFINRSEEPSELWELLKIELPPRIFTIFEATSHLHASKLDAQRDARTWKALGESAEKDEEYFPDGMEREPDETGVGVDNDEASDWVEGLRKMVQSLIQDGSIVQNSAELHNFITGTEQGIALDCVVPTFIGTREIYGDLGDIEENDGVQRVITEIKRHQSSLNKKQLDDIQGVGNSVQQHHSPNREPSKYQNSLQPVEDGPSMSLAYGSDMTFLAVGEKVAAEMALNKEQFIAFMFVMEALDEHERNPQSAIQHLQYLGGEGGTGKSTVIKAIYTVFRSLEQASAIILTAASGAAAAEI